MYNLMKNKEKSLSDETQFQTDNLSRILKLSCPTLIGHLSRIKKEFAEIFGSLMRPKMTEKGLRPSLRRSAATVAISYGKCLTNIKNHYCMSHMFHEIPTKICDFLGMTFSTLTLAFLFSLNLSTAWAATSGCDCGSTENGGSASDCCWEIDENGLLTITAAEGKSNVVMADFGYGEDSGGSYSTAPWGGSSANIQRIQNVVIGNGITNIGVSAFEEAKNLQSVTGMKDVTSIGEDAFYYATSLTGVDMPNVTTIGGGAFSEATSLTLDLPDSLQSIGGGGTVFWNVPNIIMSEVIAEKFVHWEDELLVDSNEVMHILCKGDAEKCQTILRDYYGEWNLRDISALTDMSKCGNGYAVTDGKCVKQASSCTNGASIGGTCFPRRYTPAEVAELVGEKNTIYLYYK